MNKLIAFCIVLAVFAIGLANPAVRIRNLSAATKVVIHKQGKDPLSLTSSESIKELRELFQIEVNSNRKTAGVPPYKLEFWRSASDKRPFEVIWVDRHGSWGFENLRAIYGHERKIVDFIERMFTQ